VTRFTAYATMMKFSNLLELPTFKGSYRCIHAFEHLTNQWTRHLGI